MKMNKPSDRSSIVSEITLKKEYAEIVKKNSPKSKSYVNCAKAFAIGGAICLVGQVILELYRAAGFDEDTAPPMTSLTLIFIGVTLTALGVYDKIARHAGAGTLVPITGFANAMSAPAIEFKNEGFIKGVGTRMFSIAGPVIVYGTLAATAYGAVLWTLHMFGITLF